MIELKNLSKSYGKHQVIRDISVTLHPGEIVGFLGANGAGKSTTMNMLTGCLPPSSGSILMDGEDITLDPKKVRRRVGYLPEVPPLYEGMSVYEQLCFGCRLKMGRISRSELDSRVIRACRATDLMSVKNRLISHLSKGYRQRVGLAQATLGDPEVLVLDEPTVGLDPVQIREIHKLILSLRENRIILFSSHILSEVSAVCSRILVLSDGVIAADGSPEELAGMLEDPRQLILTAAGDPEKISSTLQLFPEILHISCTPLSTGAYRFDLVLDGTDIRSDLAAALVKEQISLLSLGRRPVSLETVYERYTVKQP
ncbi:MAG: ABC transporter ATP-binding protein [Lachnospiraceae bacterium]|nr:ABC transporter ATP-binding protein [Lachnospiraceae bacterium]